MQLKYNRQPSIGSSLLKIFIKVLIAVVLLILSIFLIEKLNFQVQKKIQYRHNK